MRKILEIGFGSEPFPLIGTRKIAAGEWYFGIEPWFMGVKIADKMAKRARNEHQGRINIFAADGTRLPFPDQLFDELVIANLFGGYSTKPPMPAIIREGYRVLRVEGLLTVVETTTPVTVSPRFLERFLRGKGFKPFGSSTSDSGQIEQYNPCFAMSLDTVKALNRGRSYLSQFVKERPIG